MAQSIIEYMNSNGWNFTRHKGDIGIEIETETLTEYRVPAMTFWNWHADGSLRNVGKEFVTRGAINRGKPLDDALSEFHDKIASQYPLIKDSNSTSVHVHMNFLNNTWMHLWSFLTSYYLVENIMVHVAGPTRRSNLFCLPMCDAEASLETVTGAIRHIGNLRGNKLSFVEDNDKYAALNICPLVKFGTVESRLLRGTPDIKEIKDWINGLLAIKDYACQPGRTPITILNEYERIGPEILYPIFGDQMSLIRDVKDKAGLIAKNLHYVAKIATASKIVNEDWGFPKPKKIYKEKFLDDLNRLSMGLFNVEYKKLPYAEKLVVDERLARELRVTPAQVIFAEGDL